MKPLIRRIAITLLAAASSTSVAGTILDLEYELTTDRLIATIAYRGTHSDHRFVLRWSECVASAANDAPWGVSALVEDLQGADRATRNYTVRAVFDLQDLRCRPARVTLRTGPRVSRSVTVPERP